MNAQEQEELDLALALSLSTLPERKPCSQSDAFLTSNQLPSRMRDSPHKSEGTSAYTDGNGATRLQQKGNDISCHDYRGSDRNQKDSSGRNSFPTAPSRGTPSSSFSTADTRSNGTQSSVEVTKKPAPSQAELPSSYFSRPLQPLQQLAKQLYPLVSPMTCTSCRRGIVGTYLIIEDTCYHPECFKCAGCNQQLRGSHYPKGDPPMHYHKACAEELFSPRCCLCDSILRGQFMKHPYFPEEVYCLDHDDCQQCFACNRREPLAAKSTSSSRPRAREGFTKLHDGRVSCMDCISTAVVDSAEALPLYLEAVFFMESVLRLTIPEGMREVPILAVDLPSLNEQRNGSHTGITRGLTLSTVGEVRHISSGSLQFSSSGYITVSPPQLHRIVEVREVTAVLVLFGLPRDLTAAILAHEAMHVWMRLTKSVPYPLPLQLEEGLCQVVSLGYLDAIPDPSDPSAGHAVRENHSVFSTALSNLEYCSVIAPSSSAQSQRDSDRNRALRAYFKNQIETDCSPTYGDGFREAQKCVTALGLEIVLEVVRETRNLPTL